MMRATELAHQMVAKAVKPGDRVVDATVGNGHDTLFLAELVGPKGMVIGFDIQQAALAQTTQRLAGLAHITLHHAGHETLTKHLPEEAHGGLAAAMFNLGYLPGASKAIITRAETTLKALEQALDHLAADGLVTLVLYRGHAGGEAEAAAVRAYVRNLTQDFEVTRHESANAPASAPELIVIRRLRQGH